MSHVGNISEAALFCLNWMNQSMTKADENIETKNEDWGTMTGSETIKDINFNDIQEAHLLVIKRHLKT